MARDKHANYESRSACNAGALSFDTCEDNRDYGRFRILRSHNIGGYDVRLIDCVASQHPAFYDNGRQECFWRSSVQFKGWQFTFDDGGDSYQYPLTSGAYECFLFDGFNCYWGPFGSVRQ